MLQTAVIGQLLDLLQPRYRRSATPSVADWVARVLDAEDGDEPERLIIPQEGDAPWNETGRRAVSVESGP
ncbi:hypothetical protein P4056_14770 [Pseudomonas aeruginosa]|nr:hypothetical protein [Pseudomonas aeruginosa]